LAGDAVLALQDVRGLEDNELRDDGRNIAGRCSLQQFVGRVALLRVAVDEEGDEDVRIDDDRARVQMRPRVFRASCTAFTRARESRMPAPRSSIVPSTIRKATTTLGCST
jgi:hypothetical protein